MGTLGRVERRLAAILSADVVGYRRPRQHHNPKQVTSSCRGKIRAS